MATGAAVGVALAPHQNVLAWTTDAEGHEASVWIKGNAIEAEVVAAGPGVAIPVGLEVWQWRETEVAVPLCDCETWERAAMEGPCPETLEPGWGMRVELVELLSGESLELVPAPGDEDDGDGPEFIDYSAAVEPIASVGPFLFFRRDEGGAICGAAHGSWSSSFEVFDFERREIVDVLSSEERGRILATEQHTAYELMRGDRLVEVARAEDLELTVIEPRWYPNGLGVTYQFSARASYADSDDNWGAYTRSVQVPARELPAALAPFALIPEALGTAVVPAGDDLRLGGFGPILPADDHVAAVLRALDAGTEPASE